MEASIKRLYIITGKGGVGKTSLAMAITKSLENRGLKPKYYSFFQDPERRLWEQLQLPVLDIDLFKSAEIYIGRKLNSKIIASWIMKTNFFKSLFQMIPGLGHMILLGHLIDELEKDPHLIIILDSPASGHALTMFESSSNFKKIFKAGMIVKDIDRMHAFLKTKNNLKTIIVALANELSTHEALDLKNELQNNVTGLNFNLELIINDSYLQYLNENSIDENILPDFLKNKINLEKKILGQQKCLPHVDKISQHEIISQLAHRVDDLL